MKTLAATLAVLLVAGTAAMGQTVRDKKTCEQAVVDARTAVADGDVSDKVRAEANELVRISEHLCTQGNFVYAESLLQMARGMVAGE